MKGVSTLKRKHEKASVIDLDRDKRRWLTAIFEKKRDGWCESCCVLCTRGFGLLLKCKLAKCVQLLDQSCIETDVVDLVCRSI